MARMFGFIGNRPDLGARVLEANAALLRARRSAGDPLGWAFTNPVRYCCVGDRSMTETRSISWKPPVTFARMS